MTDPGAHHPDPLADALSRGAQHAAQLTSLIAAGAQVIAQRRILRDATSASGSDQQATRALADQERDLYRETRMGWAPAHDPRWLARADLPATGRAWAAAACYADTAPSAAAALRKCEDRLRELHPYAMARYDRLRAEGMSPTDAMCEAAPLFDRAPRPRTGGPAPVRPALLAAGTSVAAGDAHDGPQPPEPTAGPEDQAQQRGRQIAARLQAQARAQGRDELGPAELATVLETVTNLPPGMIERITQEATQHRPAKTRQAAAMTAAQLAAVSFPHTAAEAVAASTKAAAPRPALSTDRSQARRRGRSV
jgi:hypothetical protein